MLLPIYKAEHEGEACAIKHIVIPDYNEVEGLSSAQEITEYYKPCVDKMKNEIVIMQSLNGNSNVVAYFDHKIRELKEQGGREILIRMQYLTPLEDFIRLRGFRFSDVLRMGIDICSALTKCSEKNIIHRDIRETYILVDANHTMFKLGNFDVSTILGAMTLGNTKTGTDAYAAPEMVRGEQYDYMIDMYSLGIVLYKLLNEQRIPFFRAGGTSLDYYNAIRELNIGKEVPSLLKWGDETDKLLRKACA